MIVTKRNVIDEMASNYRTLKTAAMGVLRHV